MNVGDLQDFREQSLGHTCLYSGPRTSAQAPVVLFVHGAFHGAWCWSHYLKFLAKKTIAVAALDLRGHGGLIPPPDFARAGVAEMANDIAEAARALGGNIVLAGHSLGALAAMAAAERIRPRGMILLAPQPPANVTGIRLLPAFTTRDLIPAPEARRARDWFFAGAAGDIAPYLAKLCPESPAFLNDLYERRIIVDPGWIAGPSLCLSGSADDSPLHQRGQDEKIAAFFGAEYHVLARAGHCFMAESEWESGAAVIVDWLERQGLSGRARA